MKRFRDGVVTVALRSCRRGWMWPALVWIALANLTGCASTTEVGQWVASNGDPIDEAIVLERMRESDVVLLGEVHDSTQAHDKQVEMLRALDDPLVLALEQLDFGTEKRVPSNEGEKSLDARERATRLGFDFDGWGWRHYRGLFEVATARHWPLLPLNLSRQRAFAVAMADEDGWREPLEADQIEAVERLGGRLALPDAQQAELVADLEQAHCGRFDQAMATRVARAQVARDMLMADALLRARADYPSQRVVGVMGNQHARRDRGVGYWLDRAASESVRKVLSIGMLPSDSIETLSTSAAAFDVVWIIEPVDRDVDCAFGA